MTVRVRVSSRFVALVRLCDANRVCVRQGGCECWCCEVQCCALVCASMHASVCVRVVFEVARNVEAQASVRGREASHGVASRVLRVFRRLRVHLVLKKIIIYVSV